eukprot:9356890-Pyramimonas_sp.AAC.1
MFKWHRNLGKTANPDVATALKPHRKPEENITPRIAGSLSSSPNVSSKLCQNAPSIEFTGSLRDESTNTESRLATHPKEL